MTDYTHTDEVVWEGDFTALPPVDRNGLSLAVGDRVATAVLSRQSAYLRDGEVTAMALPKGSAQLLRRRSYKDGVLYADSVFFRPPTSATTAYVTYKNPNKTVSRLSRPALIDGKPVVRFENIVKSHRPAERDIIG